MEEIKVTVVQFGDRKLLQMQYKDPITGKKKTRSTGESNRRQAERVAAKWEAELREGRYKPASKITWAEFRRRYEEEVLAGLASRTDDKVTGVLNTIERILSPSKLRDLTDQRISRYTATLRKDGRAEDTIKGHLAHLQAALNWACEMGLLSVMPKIKMPKRTKKAKKGNRVMPMKGRPITREEFERMLAKAVNVVGESAETSWKWYLEGLWLSGLRLAESLELYWDQDDKLCVDLTHEHPMLRIPGELEKGNEDRLLPMAPEFAEFLLKTPEADRTGPVFNPKPKRTKGPRLTAHRVGELVSDIGKMANVKVATKDVVEDGKETKKVKYASAHDLRRSFGERWATRVMPVVLQELMRHDSIDTTMRYYVGRNAQSTAKVLWRAHKEAPGNTSSNRAAEPSSANEESLAEVQDSTRLMK